MSINHHQPHKVTFTVLIISLTDFIISAVLTVHFCDFSFKQKFIVYQIL